MKYATVFQFLLRNQAFFGGIDDKYKFFHQSARDSLAGVYLLNVAPTEAEPFPMDWAEGSFSNNIYMLHHLAEICKLDESVVINNSVVSLRKREILLDNVAFGFRY